MKEGGLPVILDLRDCLGGDLHEALDTASLFLPAGRVLATVVDNAGQARSFLSLPNQRITTDLKILDPTRAFRDGQGLLPDIAVTEGEVFETTRLITKGLEKVRQDFK